MHDFREPSADKMKYQEIAENLLRDGPMPIERIAAVSHLTLEKVKEIANQIVAE